MDGSILDTVVESKSSDMVSLTQGSAQHGRSKVVFTEHVDKMKGDSTSDASHTTGRKSGLYPMQRRGSRKQTLSLNPEEREALENLIEEVLMDGMGDGAVDSDGSSSETDEASSDQSGSDQARAAANASKVANIAAKLNNLGNTAAASGMIGGKKYYPGQLKVALKHMTNLPPRFVRKLAKAQQYLDATTSAEILTRPTPIVGRIEEEEEVGSVTHGKDELRPVVPAPSQAHSPNSSQQDRWKSKETKLLEAKKQIRTLLCDKDQYIDEKSAATASNAKTITATSEPLPSTDRNSNYPTSLTANEVSASDAVVQRGSDNTTMFTKVAESPVRIGTGVTNFISPRVSATVAPDLLTVTADHDAPHVQKFQPLGKLSVEVPDFVPKYVPIQAVPAGFCNANAASLQQHLNQFPQGPIHPDPYARSISSGSPHDPRYYIQPPVMPGQPSGYYAMPSVYNTPPPSLVAANRVITNSLPPSSGLMLPGGTELTNVNQPEQFPLPDAQYPVSMYSNTPYRPNASQPLQKTVYVAYSAPSYGTPIAAYQVQGVSGTASSPYCPVSSVNSGNAAVPYPTDFQHQNSSVPYSNENTRFPSYGSNAAAHKRMPAQRQIDFTQKRSNGPNVRWMHDVSKTDEHLKTVHAAGASSHQLSSPKNAVRARSPIMKTDMSVTNNTHYQMPSMPSVANLHHISQVPELCCASTVTQSTSSFSNVLASNVVSSTAHIGSVEHSSQSVLNDYAVVAAVIDSNRTVELCSPAMHREQVLQMPVDSKQHVVSSSSAMKPKTIVDNSRNVTSTDFIDGTAKSIGSEENSVNLSPDQQTAEMIVSKCSIGDINKMSDSDQLTEIAVDVSRKPKGECCATCGRPLRLTKSESTCNQGLFVSSGIPDISVTNEAFSNSSLDSDSLPSQRESSHLTVTVSHNFAQCLIKMFGHCDDDATHRAGNNSVHR